MWVFGAWFGRRFADNPKYLYLFVLQHLPQVRAIWICADRAVLSEVQSCGGAAALRWSLRGIWWQLRAKVAVICVDLRDLAAPLVRGAVVVNLWHGIPLKRIGADDDRFAAPLTGWRRAVWQLRNRLILAEWRRYRLMPTTSPEVQARFAQAFRLPAARAPALGFARNDILLSGNSESTRARLLQTVAQHVSDRSSIIAYLPTHRAEGRVDVSLFPFADLDLPTLERDLERWNAVLLYKGHFYQSTKTAFSAASRIIDLTDAMLDVQELLLAANVLITDLSSCYFDYLLVDRPIVFLRGVIDEYIASERGLYYPYERVTPGTHVTTFQEFSTGVERSLHDPTLGQAERKRVCRQFHTFRDANSSARVVARIQELLRAGTE